MFSRAYGFLFVLLVPLMWLGWLGTLEHREKLFLTGLLFGGIAPVLWLDTILKCGLRSVRTVPMMIRVFGRSRRGSILVGTVVLCWSFWLSPFATNPIPYRIHMSVSLAIVIALLWLQPPFALMLGESAPPTGKALESLSHAVYPLRVVGLFDHRRTGYWIGTFSVFTDNLRTERDQDWRSIVDELLDFVPLIVLDARTDSPIVVYEVGQILCSPDRLRRTLFIVGTQGEAPALFAHNMKTDSPGIRAAGDGEITSDLTRNWGRLLTNGSEKRKIVGKTN